MKIIFKHAKRYLNLSLLHKAWNKENCELWSYFRAKVQTVTNFEDFDFEHFFSVPNRNRRNFSLKVSF